MSFLTNRNKPQQNVAPIEADVLIPIEVKSILEEEKYLKVGFETILTGITATTNIFKNDSPFSIANQFVNAINPDADSLEDLVGAQLAAVFSIKEHKSFTFYNIDYVFPMEEALLELLADSESLDEDVQIEDEYEEIQPSKKGKLPTNLSSGPLEKRSPSSLGSKTTGRKAVIGPHAKRQNRPPVNPEVEMMLEDEE